MTMNKQDSNFQMVRSFVILIKFKILLYSVLVGHEGPPLNTTNYLTNEARPEIGWYRILGSILCVSFTLLAVSYHCAGMPDENITQPDVLMTAATNNTNGPKRAVNERTKIRVLLPDGATETITGEYNLNIRAIMPMTTKSIILL